jgi:uncharacterized protein (TIGR02145 family)
MFKTTLTKISISLNTLIFKFMKHLILFFTAILLLFSCEYQDNGVTSINEEITSQYLIDGLLANNLDLYIQNDQIFRYKGKPGTVTVPIGVQDFSKYEPCFVLHVSTGTTPETIVSSAIITLDGMEVLNTSDFSKNAGQFTFEVCNIVSSSAILVEVRGEPGSYIEIWIEGKLNNTVTDCDGNIYKTVTIGTQTWMTENLKTTKYRNCDPIPLGPANNGDWISLTTPAYCWYNNDEAAYKNPYGALYNWYSVNTGNLCPVGWHVPSNIEWSILFNYLRTNDYGYCGDNSYIAKSLASAYFWSLSPNECTPGNDPLSNNSSGFSAVPGGAREYSFVANGDDAIFWTSTAVNNPDYPNLAYHFRILSIYPHVFEGESHQFGTGFSVRCIKD